jgi:hypothetical protein
MGVSVKAANENPRLAKTFEPRLGRIRPGQSKKGGSAQQGQAMACQHVIQAIGGSGQPDSGFGNPGLIG